jgi:hypothetical protein
MRKISLYIPSLGDETNFSSSLSTAETWTKNRLQTWKK